MVNIVVKLAITVISGCYERAINWTLGQLDGTENLDRHALAYATRTKSMVLPMKYLVGAFQMAGYGEKAASKWINTYNDLGILSWNLMSSDRQYVSFLECPISDTDMKIIMSILEERKKFTLDAIPEASA